MAGQAKGAPPVSGRRRRLAAAPPAMSPVAPQLNFNLDGYQHVAVNYTMLAAVTDVAAIINTLNQSVMTQSIALDLNAAGA